MAVLVYTVYSKRPEGCGLEVKVGLPPPLCCGLLRRVLNLWLFLFALVRQFSSGHYSVVVG